MKMKTFSLVSFAAALAAGASVLLVGCETESAASAAIAVTPSAATLTAANASVALTASGGWGYTWSLSDESLGTLNKRSGSSVVYTATVFGTNSEQRVTVATGGTTNSITASAFITQK